MKGNLSKFGENLNLNILRKRSLDSGWLLNLLSLLLVLISFCLVTLNQMKNAFAMVGHVFESAAIATESIDSIALFLEYELIIVTH